MGGIIWIVMVVSRKPSDVWRVRAVPTACGSTDSVTSTLNCALSAMMKNPHTMVSGARIQSERPKLSPMSAQQLPLMTRARITSGARPMRSATQPPHTQPMPPTAMTANDSTAIAGDEGAVSACTSPATLAAKNAGIQVQYEYSSAMCPR